MATSPEYFPNGGREAKAVFISGISITFYKSQKTIRPPEVQLDGLPRLPVLKHATDVKGIWIWHGGMEICSESKLTIKVSSDRSLSIMGTKTVTLTIPVNVILQESADGGGGGEVWRNSDASKFEISIEYSLPKAEPMLRDPSSGSSASASPATSESYLPSTIDDITRVCPRFRVLVIGKTGVGKSSLINNAFGVTAASVSKRKPGVHDINFEIESKDNAHFVVHDSQGFEPGEEQNFNIVTNFIEERRRKPELKDKLHAIWQVLVIPCSGGRVFEIGDENFINLHLGHVPVVVVFTKFDKLVTMKRMRLPSTRTAGLSSDEVLQLARDDALQAFEKLCIDPLKTVVAGKEMPAYIKASTSKGYEETLAELVDRTYTDVRKYVAEEASLVGAIAQRTSSETKIYASIAVGKRRYWEGLGHSANFPNRPLKNCLDVIHRDVIAVWNFQDPNKHLNSIKFQELMSQIVDDLAERNMLDPNKTLVGGITLVGTIAGIIGGLSGPAAPIVIPIVATVVFAKWVYDVYKQSAPVLRCLMGYIVDLTIIMQILFMLTRGDPRPVSNRMIKLATKTYAESPAKIHIHNQIQDYVERNDVFKRMHRDGVLAKIVDLIEKWKIEEGEGIGLRLRQPELDNLRLYEDEAW
ncbi:hypothetical protein PC9H_002079 [Pleurotus ostreatus]|uniref:G domain-containing protein n=1 Tax=Pleurotus ostreatus TaxID=5322 RepID=A0A8H6ZI16_PLEOS|nr:uncharacterized protein PC9H_002079 [Pleurotus ostreatus]KAF7419488.1 hypothetical protein PC9H_002079 [Pleurotus ostreatus]